MKKLDGQVWVAGQILPQEVGAIAKEGVTLIVNNRPDGEEPGQPLGREIEAAARAAGLDYRSIPVTAGITAGQIEAMASALQSAEGNLLAFCRSGTRSAWLWALARSRLGADPDALVDQAAAAGYDLSRLRSHPG